MAEGSTSHSISDGDANAYFDKHRKRAVQTRPRPGKFGFSDAQEADIFPS